MRLSKICLSALLLQLGAENSTAFQPIVPRSIGTRLLMSDAVTAAPPAISVENLSCSHDGGGNYQLQDVNYVLPRGGKIGLVGRNGVSNITCLAKLASNANLTQIPLDIMISVRQVNLSSNTGRNLLRSRYIR